MQRRRALQPIQPAAGLSPEQQQQQQLAQRVAKNYKGRPLPLAVSASDLAGLQRIANKVRCSRMPARPGASIVMLMQCNLHTFGWKPPGRRRPGARQQALRPDKRVLLLIYITNGRASVASSTFPCHDHQPPPDAFPAMARHGHVTGMCAY